MTSPRPSQRLLRWAAASCALVLLWPEGARARRPLVAELAAIERTLAHGLPDDLRIPGARTRVVPARDATTGALLGAYQVAGPPARIEQVEVVYERERITDAIPRGRAALLLPSSREEPPPEVVPAVRVVAAVELPLRTRGDTFLQRGLVAPEETSRPARRVPRSRVRRADRRLARMDPTASSGATDLVPVRRHPGGEGLGLAQVGGRLAETVREVRVVRRSLGRQGTARFLVPVAEPGQLARVPGVGVETLVALLPRPPRLDVRAVAEPRPRPEVQPVKVPKGYPGPAASVGAPIPPP